MRSFPALVTTELAKTNLILCHLFKLVATSTYRWTDCDQDVYFDGNYWYRRALQFHDFKGEMSGEIPSFAFEMPNVNRWVSNLALSEDLRNKEFTIYQVCLDRNLKVIGYATESDIDPIFRGVIDSPTDIDRETARIQVVSHRISERGIGPKRNHSPKCQWIFKNTSTKVLGTDANTYTCIRDIINHAANRPITGGSWATYWTLAGSGGIAWVAGARSQAGTCRYEGAETWCDYTKARCVTLGNFNNFGGDEFISDLADKQVYWGQKVKSWRPKTG